MRYLASSIVFLLSSPLLAANNTSPSNFKNAEMIQAFTNATAAADHSSSDPADSFALGKPMTAATDYYMSFQCKWASLTGSINATVALEVSNDAGTTWTAKTGAVLTFSGASGNGSVSLVNATERGYRLVYTAGTTSGGTFNCYVVAK